MRVSFSRELELSLKIKAIINIMELFQEMKRSYFACGKKILKVPVISLTVRKTFSFSGSMASIAL